MSTSNRGAAPADRRRSSPSGHLAMLDLVPQPLPRLSAFEAKVRPPYQRPGIVPRARLVAALQGARTPAIAMIAPAGYGKSTTLAQIAADGRTPTAWLSADRRDEDPAVLVHELAAAIDQVAPLAPGDVAAIAAPGPSVWATAVPRLVAVLRERADLRLVIDDVDRIERPEAMDVVLALIETAVEPARIVLAGRTFGIVPFARLTARGLMTIIGRDELALDPAEANDLLATAGVRLPPAAVDDLRRRTEGWAAGLYLSALATSRQPALSEGGAMGAPERLVEEYLRTEVLDTLDPDDLDLLLAASVLDRMSGDLCDALLDRTGSGHALDRLERTNMFLIALDEQRSWYRLHHLLLDLLRAELDRRDPAAAPRYRRQAAAWYEQHDLLEEALEYAMAGEDEDRAAALTVRIGQGAVNAGRSETVRRWLAWFDSRAAARRHPRLAAYATMLSAIDGDTVRAEAWADAADLAPREGSEVGVLAIARVTLARDGLAAMLADSAIATEAVAEVDPFATAAYFSRGLALNLAGEMDEAEAWFSRGVTNFDQVRTGNVAVIFCLVHLAASAFARNDRATAERYVRRARSIVVANGLSEQLVAIGVDAAEARLAMFHGAAGQAEASLAHAQRLRPRLGVATPWYALRARFDLIRAHLALGDGGGARTLMAEAQEIIAMRPDMGTLLDERDELAARLAAVRGGEAGASTLTMAELRVLPLLTTHLTFREIGERLFVSQNTVKTQAISIYRKLDATSRSEAIDRAVELGLIGSAGPAERFIPAG